MTRKDPEQKESDASRLNAWYQQSLALIRSESGSKPDGLSSASGASDTGLGVLVLDGNTEVHADGEAGMCRQFIKATDVTKLTKPGISVTSHNGCMFFLSKTVDTIRIIGMTRGRCSALLSSMFPEASISDAEFRVLEQLVCGSTLREGAREDKVAYETKRAQFKSLSAKTGFASQSDAVRFFLAVALSQAIGNPAAASHDNRDSRSEAKSFLDLYYPGTFRFHEISMQSGRVLRVADAGPPDGKPVVFAHSQTLPTPDQIQSGWLEKSNTRLLIPLRCGFLDPLINPPRVQQHLEESAQEIIDTIRLFCGKPVRLVAQSTGTPYAFRVARDKPELVVQLTIAAAAHLGKYNDGKINTFVEAIRKLAMKSDIILEKTYDQYQKRMSTTEGFAKLLNSTYKDSAPDLDVFSEIVSNPITYSWLFETYRLSRWSVMRDIATGHLDVWSEMDNVNCPVVFVHGTHDPINPPDAAKKIQKRIPNSLFVELSDMGQSLFLTIFRELIVQNPSEWQKLR